MAPTHTHTEWLTKEEAMAISGLSDRQLRRLAAQGKIRTRRAPREPHQSAAPSLYQHDDLDACKSGEPKYHPTLELSAPAAVQQQAAAVAKAPKADSFERLLVEWLASLDQKRALAAPPAPEPTRFVSVEEAAAAFGLPERTIRELAPLWAKRGDAIDIGRGGGPRQYWRIRRAALDAPLPEF